MCIIESNIEVIRKKYEGISPLLNEFQRRIWAAVEVKSMGRGGLTAVSKATGLSRNTIKRGLHELDNHDYPPPKRVRKAGGGRKKAEKKILL